MTPIGLGQRVQITGVPKDWMRPFIGHSGRVGEIKNNANKTAYRIDGLPGGPVWFGAGCLEAVEEEEREASWAS